MSATRWKWSRWNRNCAISAIILKSSGWYSRALRVPAELKRFMIPPLSLSTFVENSCKHRGSGQTEITVRALILGEGKERFADLMVQDNGDGFSEEGAAGNQCGRR